MRKRIGRSAGLATAMFLGLAALVLAHDPKKKPAMTDDMMKGCGEHHSAAMNASDQVSMHLAEAKRSSTLAQMRSHVELADKAMADMKDHMSLCMEMKGGKMHGGTGMMGGGMKSGEMKSGGMMMGKAMDPVCGMEVDPATASSATYKGKTYYFCSEDDKQKFEKSPEQYLAKKP